MTENETIPAHLVGGGVLDGMFVEVPSPAPSVWAVRKPWTAGLTFEQATDPSIIPDDNTVYFYNQGVRDHHGRLIYAVPGTKAATLAILTRNMSLAQALGELGSITDEMSRRYL